MCVRVCVSTWRMMYVRVRGPPIEVFSAYLRKNDRRPAAKPVVDATDVSSHPARLIGMICVASYFRFFQSFFFYIFLSTPARRVIDKGIRVILRTNERAAPTCSITPFNCMSRFSSADASTPRSFSSAIRIYPTLTSNYSYNRIGIPRSFNAKLVIICNCVLHNLSRAKWIFYRAKDHVNYS